MYVSPPYVVRRFSLTAVRLLISIFPVFFHSTWAARPWRGLCGDDLHEAVEVDVEQGEDAIALHGCESPLAAACTRSGVVR